MGKRRDLLSLALAWAALSAAALCDAPRLTIPRTARPPALDGVLAEGEWDGAAAVTGILSQLDGAAHPRQATFWLMYDAQNIYVAQRSTVFREERESRVPPLWLDCDSSFVVVLGPGRIWRGDEPSHFLIRCNIQKQLLTQEIFWKLKGVRVTFPHPTWPVDAKVEQRLDERGVWTVEMAVPLAALKAEDLKDGEEWGLLLARDYSAADQNAIVLSSDWKFGDGRRHFGRAFYNNYRLEKEYARAALRADAPAVQALDLGDIAGGRLAPRLAVKNPGAGPVEVTLRLDVREGQGGEAVARPQAARLGLKPGERQEHAFGPVSLPDGVVSACVLSATGADGAVLYRQEIPIRPGLYADRTASVPEIYFSGGHFGGRSSDGVLFPSGYDPILNRFYARLRTGAVPDAHLAERVEVTIRRGGEAALVATLAPKSASAPEVELAFDDRSYGYQPATVLEWLCPEDGTVTIAMEGAHWYDPTPSSDGEAMQVLLVSEGSGRVLIPRQVFAKSKEWRPIAAGDVAVKKGDKIQFYYDKNGHESCDDFRLRGTLTHTGIATRIYSPAGELTDRQGGSSGVWFYRYDNDSTPNPDGVYPELVWATQKDWFNWVGWFKFWDKEPKRHQACIRRIVRSGGEMIVEEALPELAPGVYQATASVYAKDGRLLGRARQNFVRYDHAKDMPWIGNTLGISDRVLPPWTPITREGDTVSCLGRDYLIGGGGLFAGLKVMSQSGLDRGKPDILAGPVGIAAVIEGETVAFEPRGKPGAFEVSATGDRASWTGTESAKGWTVRTRAAMEYDGYVEYRLEIVPPERAAKIGALRLLIPLKPEHATHLHAAAGEWFRATVSSIALGKDDGVVWHSGQNYGGVIQPYGEEFGRLMTAGNFKPYVWLGDAHRGIAFMADSDAGWVPDETKKRPAIEVVRAHDRVCLVLNLVARPFAFDRPREVVFSLQATPIRPMPDDFRHRRRRYAMGSAFPGLHGGQGWAWTGQMFEIDDGKGGKQWHFGLPGSAPYPVNWDMARWYQEQADKGAFHGANWVNTPYQSQLNVMTFPEVDDPRMPPGRQASDVYGYLYPHMSQGHLEHGNASIAQADLDYRLYCYNAWMQHLGIKGMYFDQTEPVLSANPEAGFGYVLDLPDRPDLNGRVQPGYGLTRVRQFYKRLRTLFAERGVEEPFILIHSTDADMVSAFAFADTLLEGENLPLLSEEHPWMSEKIPPTRMQAMHNSPGKWGLNMMQLPMVDAQVYSHKHPMHQAIFRCWQGWFMLHDCDAPEGGLAWPGLDLKRRAVFLPYWDPPVAGALTTGGESVLASAFRQDDRLIVVVFNRAGEDQTAVALKVALDALGIAAEAGKQWRVFDAEAKEPLEAETDRRTVSVVLPVKARDYRVVRIERR